LSLASYEAAIAHSFAALGYRRRKRYVYRAEWSAAAVEHFLYVQTYGTPKEFLTVPFGFRNPAAMVFALNALRRYGGFAYSFLEWDERNDTGAAYSLGRLAKWSIRESLYLPEISEEGLALRLKLDIENLLFPIIRPLFSIERLLAFLLTDVEPCTWSLTGAAFRAAQIVHLARQVAWTEEEIRGALRPFEKAVVQALPRAPEPASFIDNVIRDSAEVGRAT
jgi:hypothetical protein